MFIKTVKVTKRVIRHSDIVDLAFLFEDLSKTKNDRFVFKVSFRDQSSVSVSNADYFQKSCFKNKDVSFIQFEYVSHDYKNRITLRLEENVFLFADTSNYEVISENEDWLNATFVKINDLITGIPKMSALRTMLSFPWAIISYVVFQAFCWGGMHLLGFTYGSRPLLPNGQPDMEAFFLSAPLYFLLVTIGFTTIAVAISLLYPAQEFAFGGARHSKRVKIRKALGWILATIIVPIVLAAII